MSERVDGARATDTTRTDGPSAAAMTETLTRVRTRYGPAALLDPVALRGALRTLDGVAPTVAEALTAVVDSGAADRLRAADADDPGPALDAATGAVLRAPGVAEADARRACEAFLAAFAADERGDPPAIRWDATARVAGAGGAGGAARHRRVLVGVGVLVAVAVGVAVVVLLTRPTAEPAAPDRYAIDQVAQRYRALGSALLAGAERCAPSDPQPGQTERVECTFVGEGWSMVLTSYDTASRLAEVRRQTVRPAADSLRSADAIDADTDTAFAMAESPAGAPTVYWDTTAPRPVSASLTSSTLPLPDLVDRYDTRGPTAQRPEVPGADFRSGDLFVLSQAVGDDGGCEPGDVDGQPEVLEIVSCTYPNGVSSTFIRLADYQDLVGYRTRYASEAGKVPGTLRGVGAWEAEGETKGQFAEFVAVDDGNAHIYFDDEAALCLGLITHPDLGQDELRELWTG
jgi:hypothetical protein